MKLVFFFPQLFQNSQLHLICAGGPNLLLVDEDEWNLWDRLGDPVLHIELRRWADLILIAPASANMMSKMSLGLADDLLLTTLRAWDMKSKPCIICPAMNTYMWNHPATMTSMNILRDWGVIIVEPAVKLLACNDEGKGALAHVPDIISLVKSVIIEKNINIIANRYESSNVPLLHRKWPTSFWMRFQYYFIKKKHFFIVFTTAFMMTLCFVK